MEFNNPESARVADEQILIKISHLERVRLNIIEVIARQQDIETGVR